MNEKVLKVAEAVTNFAQIAMRVWNVLKVVMLEIALKTSKYYGISLTRNGNLLLTILNCKSFYLTKTLIFYLEKMKKCMHLIKTKTRKGNKEFLWKHSKKYSTNSTF